MSKFWFPRLWWPAGTLLGLAVSREGEKVADPWAAVLQVTSSKFETCLRLGLHWA